MIDRLESCAELITRIIREAEGRLAALASADGRKLNEVGS